MSVSTCTLSRLYRFLLDLFYFTLMEQKFGLHCIRLQTTLVAVGKYLGYHDGKLEKGQVDDVSNGARIFKIWISVTIHIKIGSKVREG